MILSLHEDGARALCKVLKNILCNCMKTSWSQDIETFIPATTYNPNVKPLPIECQVDVDQIVVRSSIQSPILKKAAAYDVHNCLTGCFITVLTIQKYDIGHDDMKNLYCGWFF